MKKTLLFLFIVISSFIAKAQVYEGFYIINATTNAFTSDTMHNYIHDTATIPLWQIGRTRKSFFSADTDAVSIMTDTLNHYPANANNSFTIKIHPFELNVIIGFWHRYQTNTGHAGGIVEYSVDHGATWGNVKGPCNKDGGGLSYGIYTDSFYSSTDTLATGEPAFMGTRSTTLFSRFQFFIGLPVKQTSGDCYFSTDIPYVRFRFVSDTTTDTLAGWIIDSVQIRYDYYGTSVAKINADKTLPVSPIPSNDGLFIFPALKNEASYNVEVFNSIGQTILKTPYNEKLNLSAFSRGLYFYKVTDGTEYYSGRLLYE